MLSGSLEIWIILADLGNTKWFWFYIPYPDPDLYLNTWTRTLPWDLPHFRIRFNLRIWWPSTPQYFLTPCTSVMKGTLHYPIIQLSSHVTNFAKCTNLMLLKLKSHHKSLAWSYLIWSVYLNLWIFKDQNIVISLSWPPLILIMVDHIALTKLFPTLKNYLPSTTMLDYTFWTTIY